MHSDQRKLRWSFKGNYRFFQRELQRFELRVAAQDNVFFGDFFVQQVFHAPAVGGEENVAQVVAGNAVDFLGHVLVETPCASLHVGQQHALLFRHYGTCKNSVRIAFHDDDTGFFRLDEVFEAYHDFRSLPRVGIASSLEKNVRLAHSKLFEENLVHVVVVMLKRVHQQVVLLSPV